MRKNKHAKYLTFFSFGVIVVSLLVLVSFVHGKGLTASKAVAQQEFSQKANEYLKAKGETMPLLLQTDERWKNLNYGLAESQNTLGKNGCGIVSLAMVLSDLRQAEYTPEDVLSWAGNDYYVPGQGTSWEIFPAFAETNGVTCENLGTDSEVIRQKLAQELPLIISVGKGEFTSSGHIMVIKTASPDGSQVRVFDPNDTSKKQHYKSEYSLDRIMNQTLQAWSFQ